MQALAANQQTSQEAHAGQLVITVEFAAYAALFLFALVLRFVRLDDAPLTAAEARQALAAWRVLNPNLPGEVIVPQSALLFFLQSVAFTLLGATEFAARLFTALGGTALVLAPLLFRDLLGRARALLLSLLLAFSPTLLLASRFSAGALWALLAALLLLWAFWRYWQTERGSYALWATVFAASLVLLADPAGFVLALTLLGAAAIAILLTRLDDPERDPLALLRQKVRAWPWQFGLALALLAVVLVSTVFMLHQAGLSTVGETLSAGVSGVFSARAGSPLLFPLTVSLFYEPVLWLFGLYAIWSLNRAGNSTFVERFLAGWLIVATFAALYRGGGAAHALWIIMPLSGLTSRLFLQFLGPDEYAYWHIPAWARWVLAATTTGLLAVFALHLQAIARFLLVSPNVSPRAILQAQPVSVLWTLLALLFIATGLFLASGLWGNRTALQGGALGLLFFALLTSLGSGWRAAVSGPDNATEFWHVQTTAREATLLRATLLEIADRESRGFPRIPVAALAPDDGVAAWLLRDFDNVVFISDERLARAQEIALLPVTEGAAPDLGGAYVGQDFVISRAWSLGTLEAKGLLAWWTQRRTRVPAVPAETYVLWLRQDIYDGVPFRTPDGARG